MPLLADDMFRVAHRDHSGVPMLYGVAGLGRAAALLGELVLTGRIESMRAGSTSSTGPPGDALAPQVLGRTSPATRAPIGGSIIQSVLAAAGIAVYVFNGWDPFIRMFFWLPVLGGIGVLILMTVTSIAVFVYFAGTGHRDGVGTGRGLLAPAASLPAGHGDGYAAADPPCPGVAQRYPGRRIIPTISP
ncbi:GPP34 family phosphoprotein [Krasilnikovia cinnamomea]|uniref:GPP34 family phosphoprotein n=1 Tax=Krasilnikovia cinnamomea TaxID=349313 RepID=UPI00102BF7F0|nr:hypothetical protein [Krasilnikovia cinnamomea]